MISMARFFCLRLMSPARRYQQLVARTWASTAVDHSKRSTVKPLGPLYGRISRLARLRFPIRDREPFRLPEVVALGVEVHGQPHRNDGLNSALALRHGLSATVAWSAVAQAIPDVHRIDTWREAVDQSSPDQLARRLRKHLSRDQTITAALDSLTWLARRS
jgi:hypothetical protein